MSKAQKRSATLVEKFWFRKNITSASKAATNLNSSNDDDSYTLMSIDEIINGKVIFHFVIVHVQLKSFRITVVIFQTGEFPGLIPLIHSYLAGMEVDTDTHCTIQQYLKLISRRASGQIDTTASWIRRFVQEHAAYKYVILVVNCF